MLYTMTQSIRFIKPSDLRATIRGLAIMSVLFDEQRRSRFWTDSASAADVGIWNDDKGNSCCFLFIPKGSVIFGFDRQSPLGKEETKPWPGIYDDLPAELQDLVNRRPYGDAFPVEDVTFCIWNTGKGLDWKKGKIDFPKKEPSSDPDGAKYVLGRMKEYFDHFDHEMDEEYEQSFDADTLFQVFSGDAVSPEDLRRLKSGVDLAEVRDALKEIGVKV
jgi:hypothetical protein